MIFILLPAGKIHKKPEKLRLKTFPAGYIERFYRNLADNVYIILGSDFYGKITNDYVIPSDGIQKYILATNDFAKGMQTEINHYVTKDSEL